MNQHVDGPNVFTELDGLPIRWTDPDFVTHAVEGTQVPGEGMLFWRRCGDGEVPVEGALFGHFEVTCTSVAVAERNAMAAS
ncbi:hypothetical protein [Mesorhizobium sp. CN2-181]|uniref:hypothetical protein n=1 Tax=Mesorhizobium yinganensis TaxID=3157707 RepID=UPI0032B71BDB